MLTLDPEKCLETERVFLNAFGLVGGDLVEDGGGMVRRTSLHLLVFNYKFAEILYSFKEVYLIDTPAFTGFW